MGEISEFKYAIEISALVTIHFDVDSYDIPMTCASFHLHSVVETQKSVFLNFFYIKFISCPETIHMLSLHK